MSRPRGPVHPAYFHLVDDGGWLTTAGIAMEVGHPSEVSLERNLYRWRAAGYVERRQVELASSTRPSTRRGGPWGRGHGLNGRVEVRLEWRAE